MPKSKKKFLNGWHIEKFENLCLQRYVHLVYAMLNNLYINRIRLYIDREQYYIHYYEQTSRRAEHEWTEFLIINKQIKVIGLNKRQEKIFYSPFCIKSISEFILILLLFKLNYISYCKLCSFFKFIFLWQMTPKC